MQRLFSLLLLLTTTLSLVAQSYTTLWKQVNQAHRNDLPQTALRSVQTIRQKAQREGNVAQLIRATTTEATLRYEIAPDSARSVIEQMQNTIQTTTVPLHRALWQNVLGQWLRAHWAYTDTALRARSEALIRASLSDVELLGKARMTHYAPLFVSGKSSAEVFGDDLLSVMLPTLPDEATDEHRAILDRAWRYYDRVGKARAALHTAWQWVSHHPWEQQKALLEALRQQYLPLKDNAETYHRLCEGHLPLDSAMWLAKEGLRRYGRKHAPQLYNWVQQQEAPTLNLDWGHATLPVWHMAFYPGEQYWAKWTYRNVRRVALRLHRLVGVEGSDKRLYDRYGNVYSLNEELDELLRTLPSQVELNLAHALPQAQPHQQRTDSLRFTFPQAGVYLVELLVEGQHRELSLAFASRAMALRLEARSASALIDHRTWVDALSGGDVELNDTLFLPPRDYYERNQGRQVRRPQQEVLHSRLFTDRAIYRPGQKVELSGLLYEQKGDTFKVLSDHAAEVFIYDAEQQCIDTLQVKTDAFGVLTASYVLPRQSRLGNFRAELRQASVHFVVEEYKRPTFTVELDTLPNTLRMGQKLVLRGKVQAYNGVPLSQVRVQWNMQGHPLWYRQQGAAPFDCEGTQTTDSLGQFALEVQLPDYPTPSAYRLAFQVEVLADNGEQQRAAYTHYLRPPHTSQPETPKPLAIEVSPDQTTATLIVRTPCFLHYMLLSEASGVREHRVIEVKDSVRLSFRWQEEMGDGATLLAAYVRQGELHSAQGTLVRPRPDKRLVLRWSTFRSQLQPGQHEEWTLRVLHPDGRPAAASVMARLYDASLDAFAQQPWDFAHHFDRLLPEGSWQRGSVSTEGLYHYRDYATLPLREWQWSAWRDLLFNYSGRGCIYQIAGGAKPLRLSARSKAMDTAMPMVEALSKTENIEEKAAAPQNDAMGMSHVPLRTNFNETAFFFPRLHTDKAGQVSLRFTLPESLTAWNFSALATDDMMNYGLLHERVVARKQLSAEMTLPRFVREGDRVVVPCQVRNLDERPARGQLHFVLLDEVSGKEVARFERKFSMGVGQTTHFDFAYAVPDGLTQLTARLTAKSDTYSDGEERLLPVLSRFVTLTHAQPFTVKAGETYAAQERAARERLLAQLEPGVRPTLATDTCKNAHLEVVKVVPQLLEVKGGSATDWATTLYGISLAKVLKAALPLDAVELEKRRHQAEDELSRAQLPNGAWAWYKGMHASPWITTDVAFLLARLRYLTGWLDYDYLIARALRYLDGEVAREVRRMQEVGGRSYISEWHYRYLYIGQLMGREHSPFAQYLIDLIPTQRHQLSMYGKSGVAVILSGTAHEAEARLALESLVEHTVLSEEMGRSFDTDRAFGGWASYRIPTQTFAIEALRHLKHNTEQVAGVPVATLVSQLKLWLLQSKRTQVWNSSRATTDAVFSLLSTPPTLEEPLTWGAVTATYRLPAAQALQKGKALMLDRRLQRKRGAQWIEVAAHDTLRVGEHVRWVYTIKADRDVDYLTLHSMRPACFETLRPLSGYAWEGGLPHYRMSRDSLNELFIEHLAKGQHTLTDEMVVSQAGRYDAGIATLHSVFAPEFRANSNALIFNTERSPAE